MRVCDTRILYLTAFFLACLLLFSIFAYSYVSTFHLFLAPVIINISVMCLCLPNELGLRRRKVNTDHFRFYLPFVLRSSLSILEARRVEQSRPSLCFLTRQKRFLGLAAQFSLLRDSNVRSRESRVTRSTIEPPGPLYSVS